MFLNSFDQNNNLESINRVARSFKKYFLEFWASVWPYFQPPFSYKEASKWSQINVNGLKWKFVISINGFDQNNSLELINRASRSFKLQFFQFLPNLTLFRPQSFFWKALKWSQIYANGLKWEFVISLYGFYQNSLMIRPSIW